MPLVACEVAAASVERLIVVAMARDLNLLSIIFVLQSVITRMRQDSIGRVLLFGKLN